MLAASSKFEYKTFFIWYYFQFVVELMNKLIILHKDCKMKKFKELDTQIKSAKSILIISHVNPDGDTLGTMCALNSIILKHYRKKAEMLILSKVPKIYEFLPHISDAKTIDKIDRSREYDLVVTVDVASLDRIVDAQILFEKAKFSVNIDHHQTNILFGKLAIVDSIACSTGEVVFEFLKKLKIEPDIDTANALYTAILTDTGGFRFENTKAKTFKLAAELLAYGVNSNELYRKCYESKSKDMVLFQSYCVSKAVFLNNDKIAYTVVYKKDMEKFSAGEDYTDGIAELLRAIVTTDVSFVVKEVDSRTCKISMRSKKQDISKVCAVFGGGGHKFAAGCTIKASCEDSVKKLLAELNKEI